MTTINFVAVVAVATLAISIFNHLKLKKMAKTQAEHAQELRDLKAQNEKSRTEVLDKIAKLEEALANAGSTTPEVDAAFAELKASVQADDDIVPDAPPAETPAEPSEPA